MARGILAKYHTNNIFMKDNSDIQRQSPGLHKMELINLELWKNSTAHLTTLGTLCHDLQSQRPWCSDQMKLHSDLW